MRPDGKNLRPDGKNLRPNGKNLRPDGKNLRPNGKNLRPDGNTLNHIAGCLLSFLVACTVCYLMSETQANSGKAAHFTQSP